MNVEFCVGEKVYVRDWLPVLTVALESYIPTSDADPRCVVFVLAVKLPEAAPCAIPKSQQFEATTVVA